MVCNYGAVMDLYKVIITGNILHRICISISSFTTCWLCGSVVERRSLAGELSLSCARPVADG